MLKNIDEAAARLMDWSKPARIFTFSGTLGAGKTTFIRTICDILGVKDAVSSPTFALINDYVFGEGNETKHILHMDWYRLKDEEEALNAGMEDALQSDARFCFVEWPEKAPELLRLPHISIKIEEEENGGRRLIAEHRERYEA